jgi:uncharacterized protein YcfL
MTEPVIPGVLEAQSLEPRSSVSVKTTAKGEVQVDVKVYTGDIEGVDAAKAKAVETFNALRAEVGA